MDPIGVHGGNEKQGNELDGGNGSGSVPITDPKPIIQKTRLRRPPHNYSTIVKDADKPFDHSSIQAICEQLYSGVLLNQGRKKYWVDKDSNKNCFTLFARELGVVWRGDEDNQYWEWMPEKETSGDEVVEVSRLQSVCWLEINGLFQTAVLSGGTTYQVILVFKMEDENSGFSGPACFDVTLPDKTTHHSELVLDTLPTEEWTELLICDFTLSPENVGELHFRLLHTYSYWMTGFVIKGLSFRPKK